MNVADGPYRRELESSAQLGTQSDFFVESGCDAPTISQAKLRKDMKAEYAANDEPVLQMPLKGMSAASLHAKLAEKVGPSGVHAHRPAQEASASQASDCLSVSRAVNFTGCLPCPRFLSRMAARG